MENKNFEDFNIAKISEEDVKNISELEKTLSSKAENDIVLIAYQPKDKGDFAKR
ncbi:hypothetical protein EDD66_10797 [Mobilisporobacter senegalensis]|uniref:Uncharacterized protein n=1 Tax=Mobilisporobacter senegalensis TaxID=1329262 RepID=A0A3N1XKF9_9FIRM|nr:hypothetical protein [Mobilisporobacter senegalensis]ROR27183.1 hypothetical protein EDD66_10797 [Mobilisporobacter senegalensis]